MRARGEKNRARGPGLVAVGLWLLLAQLLTSPAAGGQVESEPRDAEIPNFHRVNARLYRGGQPRRGGIRRLAALGVNTIINLREDDERARAEEREAREAGLRYFNVPLRRMGRPSDEQVERALSLIDAPESGVVFVHCAKGEDRTGTVVAVYRIAQDGWTSAQAKQEANRYGMRFWQRGMKDYIRDYYRDRAARAKPVPPARRGRGALRGSTQPPASTSATRKTALL